jgi:hypothetical protein
MKTSMQAQTNTRALSSAQSRFNLWVRTGVLGLCALLATGCVTHETRPQQRVNAVRAAQEIPEAQLLDVGVHIFDANVPEDEKAREKARVFAEVRRAEARYVPMQLRNTLEGTGHWGQVRVVPSTADALDVRVSGRILESTGMKLKLDISVSDAAGRQWFSKVYDQEADTRSYREIQAGKAVSEARDPFQNLYSTIANDMLAYRQQLAAADVESIRSVSELRFASDLAPYAFTSYLSKDKKGQYQVIRLPAQDDPLLTRMERIRERDYALLDTVNEHYAVFGENMAEPYSNWRRYSHDELEAEDDAKRSALTRKLLGAAAIIGGIVAGTESGSYAGQAAATAAVVGGVYAVKSGFDKGAEVKMHSESLKQLGESFEAEIQPVVVELEGRTLQLTGTAEEQYREWRRLLKELYENETGLSVTQPSAAATPGSDSSR